MGILPELTIDTLAAALQKLVDRALGDGLQFEDIGAVLRRKAQQIDPDEYDYDEV